MSRKWMLCLCAHYYCNVVLKTSGDHNHLLYPENMELRYVRTKVKEYVMNETNLISKIYEDEVILSQMSPRTLAIIPLARKLCKDNVPLT
ncbi:unnamed protein product [Rotaria sordida]|uniref:Uncharacterized protein n=1 Tax=Rotaria sordida TaxID=392033 RepID=A0A814CIY8_9BILA|nr:unnamed protein product [Rotaria sordida]